MLQIESTDTWHDTFPGAYIGILLVGNVDNTKRPTPLDTKRKEIELKLRKTFAAFSREDFLKIDVLKAYRDYYKQFGNTYHVQAQLESIIQKNKPLPNVSPLVDANFAAELETLVLTAGHDADLLEPPLKIDASQGGELFMQMNGSEKTLKPNDMIMSDTKGTICTIIYGQDKRTPISPKTKQALYVAYAPEGVSKESVRNQLETIRENIFLFAPKAKVEMLEIFCAKSSHA